MRTLVSVILFLSVATPLLAQSIFRCEGDQGEPVFSNVHCGGPASPVELGRDGVMDGSASMGSAHAQLERLRQLPEVGREKRRRGSRRMGFGERMELRKLQIRADGLRRDLLSPRGARARAELQRELRKASKRIEELRAKQ